MRPLGSTVTTASYYCYIYTKRQERHLRILARQYRGKMAAVEWQSRILVHIENRSVFDYVGGGVYRTGGLMDDHFIAIITITMSVVIDS